MFARKHLKEVFMPLTDAEFLEALHAAQNSGDTPDQALQATRITARWFEQGPRPSQAIPAQRSVWLKRQARGQATAAREGLRHRD